MAKQIGELRQTLVLVFKRDRLHLMFTSETARIAWDAAIEEVRRSNEAEPSDTVPAYQGWGYDAGGKRFYRRGDFKAVEGVR